ncbi:hypothetical protein [Atopomonas hussainii]|uniref:hypothetical protein n=1 Tax=Atopomonas hussainii TaxID=1429083 RepID=UPI0009004469|nr:hypothetical protein [Atopomonas hussainii]
MQYLRSILAISSFALITGCAGGLNSIQNAEYAHFEAAGLTVEEKSPGAGAVLGLLPGGGSFYGREYGYGAVNLLFWPLSILWDPISGYNASKAINYYTTKQHVKKLENKEMSALEEKLTLGQIDTAGFSVERRKIEQKYNPN